MKEIKKITDANIPVEYRAIYTVGEDDPDSYKTGDKVDGMTLLASLDPRDDESDYPYAYLTDSTETPVVTIVHDRVYAVSVDGDWQ